MNDPEVEHLLRRYRPAGPPPHLRSLIVAPLRVQRIWPWATAAAVLLASMMALRVGARSEAASVDLQLGPDAAERAVEELSQMLGDTTDARALAESMVMAEQLRADTAPLPLDEESGGRR
jgi:hypothetical protein